MRIIRLLSRHGSVVNVMEYSLAKEILYRCGFGQRREDGDTLLVFPDMDPKWQSFYVRRDSDIQPLARLTVDEGMQEDCLLPQGRDDSYLGMNRTWEEMVDATSVLRLIVERILPEAARHDSFPCRSRAED